MALPVMNKAAGKGTQYGDAYNVFSQILPDNCQLQIDIHMQFQIVLYLPSDLCKAKSPV
jgi:hypothetical protein